MGFKRYDGFVMHVPQEFIDNSLPVCPFCHTDQPHWLLDSKLEFSLSGGRTYYQCEKCKATMSSLPWDAAAGKGKGFAYNPAAAALNAAQKGAKHQEVGVPYLRVEDLGSVCGNKELLKNEYPVTFFQKMAGESVAEVNVQQKTECETQKVVEVVEEKIESINQDPVEKESTAKRVLAKIGFPLSLVSMIMGLLMYIIILAEAPIELAMFCSSVFMLCSIAGMVLSIIGRGAKSCRGRATVGMVFGIVGIVLHIVCMIMAVDLCS